MEEFRQALPPDDWMREACKHKRALVIGCAVRVCSPSCLKYHSKGSTQICRHNFYHVVNLYSHESEQTALTSYHLKIYVKEMSEGTVYYRGVTKCEATSTEEAGDNAFSDRTTFTERITLILESAGRRKGCNVAAAAAEFAALAAVAVLMLGWEQ